jgi:hypothetical protein
MENKENAYHFVVEFSFFGEINEKKDLIFLNAGDEVKLSL